MVLSVSLSTTSGTEIIDRSNHPLSPSRLQLEFDLREEGVGDHDRIRDDWV